MRGSLPICLLLASLALAGARVGPAGGGAVGGVLRLARSADFDSLDPALAYETGSWSIEYATCAKLFNYPDRPGAAGTEVVPEVVRRFTLSADRRTYTFDLKRTFRFQTGERVTAASFAAAFNRDAAPQLRSPASTYMHEIVGADAVLAGKAATIAGVRVLGPYRLQLRLTRPRGDFTARLTMPFFCPLPPGTPGHELELPPGSGPYYIAEHIPDHRIVLRRNPHYRGGRPANVDEVVWRLDLEQEDCVAAVEQNLVDRCELPLGGSVYRGLADKYGINRPGGRFFVGPALEAWYLAFNHDRPAFKGAGQIPLAKAINYAIDRPALARAFGYLAGRRGDRILPPPLGRAEHDYPIAGADPTTAEKWLARAALKPEKLVLYTANSSTAVAGAEVVAYDLRRIGIDVEVKYFSPPTLFQKTSKRGEPFDIAFSGWAADYADPADFFRPLLDGKSLRATDNTNISYLDDAEVNAAIDAADRLTGAARRRAFADLDAALMRTKPPLAPFFYATRRTFLSASVGCFFTQPVYGFDVAAVCKK